MRKLTANQLRSLWMEFFTSHGHKQINSASLIPENDPTVLFTTAGMHPLVPYLLGNPHPSGKRLCNAQKCVRTDDINEVGDEGHLTFFEMLGNWSLGDFFKETQIPLSFEFLTKILQIPLEKLSVSVFEGDESVPRDDVSAQIWQKLGVAKDRIFFLGRKHNWWGPAGKSGPCGPDTEMFVDTGKPACSPECSPACSCGKYLEIWNDVFMEYNKLSSGEYAPLKQKNVDTGMGLERTICILQGVKSVFETELFIPLIDILEQKSGKKYKESEQVTKAMRIIADHIRTSVFLMGDQKGITPSNVDQGYILRRLIRRAARFGRQLELDENAYVLIAQAVIDMYCNCYPELERSRAKVCEELSLELARFNRTLKDGLKEFEKIAESLKEGATIEGKLAFRLYDTYGFPLEITEELAYERNLSVDTNGYAEAFKVHQEKSAMGAGQKFSGGLADNTDEVARLHTATHLMHAALRKVLGNSVEQRGSNITAERLRFDFSFARPMTAEEIKQVEALVNEAINAKVDIAAEQMSVGEAKALGAIGLFEDKYGEKVFVYTMGEFSKEICGGPHAKNTGELGIFKIQKEQSSSSGVRRIKAVLTTS